MPRRTPGVLRIRDFASRCSPSQKDLLPKRTASSGAEIGNSASLAQPSVAGPCVPNETITVASTRRCRTAGCEDWQELVPRARGHWRTSAGTQGRAKRDNWSRFAGCLSDGDRRSREGQCRDEGRARHWAGLQVAPDGARMWRRHPRVGSVDAIRFGVTSIRQSASIPTEPEVRHEPVPDFV